MDLYIRTFHQLSHSSITNIPVLLILSSSLKKNAFALSPSYSMKMTILMSAMNSSKTLQCPQRNDAPILRTHLNSPLAVYTNRIGIQSSSSQAFTSERIISLPETVLESFCATFVFPLQNWTTSCPFL
jgi:hypothetical protein